MAINATSRDILNFPGGTPKTITLDIAQVVLVGGSPEGDQVFVSSATTTATASGAVSIQPIFKNSMKRGFLRGLRTSGLVTVPSSYGIKVAIDESIGSGVDIQLDSGNNLLPENVAQDLENKLRAQARIGGGGAKIGDLSYLNAQVRYVNNRFVIESGTVTDSYTGVGRSSVSVSAPSLLGDARSLLGLQNALGSEELASRQIFESDTTSTYSSSSSGDLLTVTSTAGLNTGDAIFVTNGTVSDKVLVSGIVSATQFRFITRSGAAQPLANSYAIGSLVTNMHRLDVVDPVSAVTTVDQLYRFAIDSMTNQIDYSA